MDNETSPLLTETETDVFGGEKRLKNSGLHQDANYSSIIQNDHHVGSIQNIIKDNNNDTDKPQIKVYKRRWYVLFIYCFFAAAEGGMWNTWSPISDSAKDAFGWTDSDIALLFNWGPITYLLVGIFFSWMMEVKGLRLSCLLACFLVTSGAGVGCITSTPPWSTWMIHLGQFLVGLGGPIGMGAPPVISAVWFPPNERTTATSIAVLIPNIGIASAFIIGPFLVPYRLNGTRPEILINSTQAVRNIGELNIDSCQNATERIESERRDIMFLMYIEFGGTLLVFLVMLIYFPKKPPLPPCKTASVDRQEYWTGFKAIFRCKQFWLVAIAYGISLGVCNVWTGVLDLNLSPLGISQNEAGWIGFYSTCAACLASLVIARFADIFSKNLKLFVLILYLIGTGFIVWFALACDKIVHSSTAVFYITVIMGVMTLNATVPLLFELACELTYPIGEGTTNIMMTLMHEVGSLVFLGVLMIPDISTMWMNWTLIGTTVICFPLYGLLQETYNRLDVDVEAVSPPGTPKILSTSTPNNPVTSTTPITPPHLL